MNGLYIKFVNVERKKSMKISKPKKINKTKLKRKADSLFSLKVRSIGYCQAEGKMKGKCGGQLQACHIQGRANYRLRWDQNNLLCMCAGHHRLSHTYPLDFIEMVMVHFPEKWAYVMKHKNETRKTDYTALLTQLQMGEIV